MINIVVVLFVIIFFADNVTFKSMHSLHMHINVNFYLGSIVFMCFPDGKISLISSLQLSYEGIAFGTTCVIKNVRAMGKISHQNKVGIVLHSFTIITVGHDSQMLS